MLRQEDTQSSVIAPAQEGVPFINDGSIEYAIELANRVPLSALPKFDFKFPTLQAPELDPKVAVLVSKLNNDDWYDHVPEWARAEIKPDMYKHIFDPIVADLNSRARTKYSN